jgi:hypothetical protein
MGYSTRQSLARATLVNQDQGGGPKKMGLVPRENIPAATARYYKNSKQTLMFTQTLQYHQVGVSVMSGGVSGLVMGRRQR